MDLNLNAASKRKPIISFTSIKWYSEYEQNSTFAQLSHERDTTSIDYNSYTAPTIGLKSKNYYMYMYCKANNTDTIHYMSQYNDPLFNLQSPAI